jgi:hypothetical protein
MSMPFGSFPPMHPLCFPDSFGMAPGIRGGKGEIRGGIPKPTGFQSESKEKTFL